MESTIRHASDDAKIVHMRLKRMDGWMVCVHSVVMYVREPAAFLRVMKGKFYHGKGKERILW